jgi:hypothetical protein
MLATNPNVNPTVLINLSWKQEEQKAAKALPPVPETVVV